MEYYYLITTADRDQQGISKTNESLCQSILVSRTKNLLYKGKYFEILFKAWSFKFSYR